MPTKPHPPSRKSLLRRQLGLGVILLAGVAASAVLHRLTDHAEHRRVQEEFFRRAEVRHALISQSLQGFEECLYNLRNLFTNSDTVTPAEFSATARDIRVRHPGVQALQWVPVVPDAARADVEAWGRQELAPDFGFTELDADRHLVPAATRPVYHPILYTDPLEGNERALGYDLRTGPTVDDLRRAVNTRGLVMTRKLRLVQETALSPGSHGVIMACPVFYTVDGVERVKGFVQIVFKLDDMLALSWVNYPANELDALILDATEPAVSDPFIFSRRPAGNTPAPRTLDELEGDLHVAELSIGGRTWACYYTPATGWIDQHLSNTPALIFAGGLVLTLVLAAYFLSVRRRAELVEQQVDERTAELRHTQELLESDIAKRQAVEAELRESRRQLDSLLSQMPGMAYRYIHRAPPTPVFISRGSIEIIGFTPQELTSGDVAYEALILPEDRTRHEATVATALSNQADYESEYRLHDKQGRVKWVLDRGQGIYSNEGQLLFIEGLAIDITGRKQAEEEKTALDRKLLESQKLESLGVLAGGIAHDFNNLLTGIMGHASILRMDIPGDSPLQAHLEHIEAGSRRAGELCQQMLAYAGKGRFLVQCTSLEKLVRDTTPLLEHSISKRAQLRFEFRPDVPEVEADATQIRQIIMNLVVNASDAIGDRDGEIFVETLALRRDEVDLSRAVLPPPPDKTRFAGLRVRDTGSGMSAETLAKIFEPFYTTKFAGRGLGLAAVLGIVRSHDGGMLVTSATGVGTTFTLLLPAATATPPAVRESRPPIEGRAHPLAGTVLLIDDETSVRGVAEQMFRSFGLKVLVAADGVEGVALFKQHQSSISLVLLDLTMPRMSGADTLRALRQLTPHLPVILMSGYNQSAVPELGTDEHVSFLQKPFTLQALRTRISEMLR